MIDLSDEAFDRDITASMDDDSDNEINILTSEE